MDQNFLLFQVSLLKVFLQECWRSEEALESTETIEWKACAAILDFICPLFGRGFLPPKLLVIAVAGTLLTLLLIV